MTTTKFIWNYYKKYLASGIFIALSGLIISLGALLLPQISRYIIDYVLNPEGVKHGGGFFAGLMESGKLGEVGTGDLLTSLCLIFAGIVILRSLLQYFSSVYVQKQGNKFYQDIRVAGFRKLFILDYSVPRTESFLTVTHDALAMRDLCFGLFSQYSRYVLYVVCALIMLIVSNWIVGVIMLAVLPIAVIIQFFLTKATKNYFINARQASLGISVSMENALKAIKEIKTNDYTQKQLEILNEKNNIYLDNKKQNVKKSFGYIFALQCIRALFYASVIFLSGYLAITGKISIGMVSVLVSYGVIILDNVNNAVNKFYNLEEAYMYTSIFKKFMSSRTSKNKGQKIAITEKPNIEFDNAKFALLASANSLILQAKLNYGDKLGLCVENGTVKSMISRTLLNFARLESGDIRINSNSINTIKTYSLRKLFSVSFEENYIMQGSLKDNIVMFDDYDENKFTKIIEICELGGYISTLENGLNTNLSSIEDDFLPTAVRQKICIARMLYNDDDVFVLESPLTALDDEQAFRIINRIFEEYNQHSIILLSTKKSLLLLCKQISVLKSDKTFAVMSSHSYEKLLEVENEKK